jgi:hypothetical protein
MKAASMSGHASRHPLGLEPLNPLGDSLGRRVELARGGGFGQPAIHHRANHHLSTSWRQRRILVRVHSVLCESLAFGHFSVTVQTEWTTS